MPGVKGDNAVNASVLKQVCHQTSINRLARAAAVTNEHIVRDNTVKLFADARCGVGSNPAFP